MSRQKSPEDDLLTVLVGHYKKHGRIHDDELARLSGYKDEFDTNFRKTLNTLAEQRLAEHTTLRLDIDGKNPLPIWPTPEGIKQAEELNFSLFRRFIWWVSENKVAAFVLTFLSVLLGLIALIP